MGQEYTPRAIPYNPFFQRLGRPTPNPSPELLGYAPSPEIVILANATEQPLLCTRRVTH